MRDNVNLFGNTSEPIGSAVYVILFGPATLANMGGGIATIPDDANGDIEFQIEGLSSETMAVTISDDGTNYSASLLPFDVTNGVIVAAATLADGKYRLPLKDFGTPKYVKFTKSATSESVAVALGVSRASIKF